MKSITKRLTSLLLVGLIGTACAACNKQEVVETSEAAPNYTLASYDFTTVYTDGEEQTLKVYNPDPRVRA